jgi:hypothetical protein
MTNKYSGFIFLLIMVFCFGCKEPYEPNLPSIPQGFLVVEGVINAQGPTRIKLSRTTPLDQKKTFKPELNASLWVEGDDNSSFALLAQPNGLYSSVTLPINPSRQYRLRIKTKDTKEYISEFVPVKITPAIDSISWKEDQEGVTVYANAHDDLNKTIYYQWDYDETWEIRSAYYASWRYVNGIIRASQPTDPPVYYCWKYDTSSNIHLGSSAKLEKDIIHLHPLLVIPNMDEKLGIRYSIQVRQYALGKEGYQFFEQMKKNTELLGSIFDPQPSALKGNIRAVSNPDETVIGYISVATIQQKRIFISKENGDLRNPGFNMYNLCQTDSVDNHPDSIKAKIPHSVWPYEPVYMGIFITHYLSAPPACVDCRERKGINVKPSFW